MSTPKVLLLSDAVGVSLLVFRHTLLEDDSRSPERLGVLLIYEDKTDIRFYIYVSVTTVDCADISEPIGLPECFILSRTILPVSLL